MRKMKREGKKVNEDQFSLDKDNEVRCINGKDSILVSPIFYWSESDVWYFLNNILGVPHCELYDQGYTRIGCILCPISQFKHKQRELRDFPHVKRGWIRAIKEIRARGGVQQNEYTQDSSGGTFQQSDCREKSAGCSATGSAAITPPHNQRKVRDLRKLVQQKSMERNVSATGSGSSTTGGFSTHTNKAGAWIHGSANNWGLEQTCQQRNLGGFSANPSADGAVEGVYEPTEDEIAEKIFDWWISGKSYTEWYAEKYLQLKIPFDDLGESEGSENTL